MTVTATISSKGQITIPVRLRRLLDLKEGQKIELVADKNSIKLSRAETIDEMSARFSKYIKPGIKPLKNVSKFFQTRNPRI
jgi:AbrB family looped-hinge helix DNA binding protein